MSWLDAARARARLLLSRRGTDARTDEEFRFHLEMETDRLVREHGLAREEAHRRASAAFGGVQQHRESMRDGRGLTGLSGLSLDLKLGVRMLAKYPGLTLVGGLAMAFGIWFGAVTFHLGGILTGTKLPIPDSDRIVKVQVWDQKESKDEDRVLLDYQLWQSARTITDIGAFRDVNLNLVGTGRSARPTIAAEITASAFRIAPARPLLGRVLDEADQRAGAAPVVLLGYDVWTQYFDGDSQIVGRDVQIGNGFATVVGVMPEDYAFPVSHELWIPLRTDVPATEPRRGIAITVFGRLASGESLASAQAEFATLGARLAAAHPETHAQLQPHVVPYAQSSVNPDDEIGTMLPLIYFFVVVLVVVVCSTVALLLFARAASRETEILVRSALGASRRRIITQLFAEALVLAGVASIVGLLAAQRALTIWGRPYLEMNLGRLPFWYDFTLSPRTVTYALALAVIGAVVAGVLPARKITRGIGTKLRAGTSGGGTVSFGGIWTAVIITQVALTVTFPAVAMLVKSESTRIASQDVGFADGEYLGVSLRADNPYDDASPSDTAVAGTARFVAALETMRQRLEADADVAGVTFVDRLPRDYHAERRLELEAQPSDSSLWVSTASIDPSYFDVLQAPMLAGRAFTSADLSTDAHVVIVDQGFADLVMPGRNLIGHRVRMRSRQMSDSAAALQPWHEIVGVVKELGMTHAVERQRTAGVYLPAVPGSQGALQMIVHTRADPLTVAARVREVATGVDPALRVEQVIRLDQFVTPLLWFLGLWTRIIAGLTLITLLLSLGGIYAVLSYTVARRTREIGVRVAMGASARRVITALFRRPLTQVALGVLAGSALIAVGAVALQYTEAFGGAEPRWLTIGELALLAAYAFAMLAVCAMACVVPTVRALRVQPTEALRAE